MHIYASAGIIFWSLAVCVQMNAEHFSFLLPYCGNIAFEDTTQHLIKKEKVQVES